MMLLKTVAKVKDSYLTVHNHIPKRCNNVLHICFDDGVTHSLKIEEGITKKELLKTLDGFMCTIHCD